ncbi:VCBS domain-containing protein [Bradyrhizobium monzae]|uniref:VCBS domain-containing protein n=1 Tax=Bradyrhizobium sp. Oc8 TaxID=2876780 RepID=UPI001F180AA0|nr:VCBS domain-containing protein [Bradyrhizobium sp. Oc8]
MPVTSAAGHGDEREATTVRHSRPKMAKRGFLGGTIANIRERAPAGSFWTLSLTALLFSALKEAKASDPNVTLLDDDTLSYKDLAHGVFELTTKEAVPRHIIVEDPGQTVILNKVGSGLSVNQLENSPFRMEELRAAQQEALANFAKGYGTNGSGTPPFVESLPLEPIHFIPPDAPAAPNALPPIQPIVIPEILIIRTPPTLNAQAGPLELDTAVFDTFTATSGTFSASSPSSNVTLTFSISGGASGNTVLDGVTYDVSKTGPYGTLFLNGATGAYTFVPDSAAINALKAPTSEAFSIIATDGSLSANQIFTIAINGANDAAIIAGTTTGSSLESGGVANAASGGPAATGKLSAADVDDPANTFAAVNSPTQSAHGYGTFTITADGVWTYTLDQSNNSVQALNVGQTLTDTFTVTSIDGTPQLITITINGANDAAVISGTATGTVTEAGHEKCEPSIATGQLTDTDVDNIPNSFTPVTSPRASDHGYGCFKMTADGVWTYTLDDNNCTVQALNVGDTLTDTFTVTTIDGTAQLVTITIHGTNDPAIIRGCTTGSVTEPDCEHNGRPAASGRLTDTDVDNPPNTFTAVACPTRSAGGYGTFTMTAAGVWTYTLDTANCAVQALHSCETLTDTFTVTSIDGTEQSITITIHGADDRDDFGHGAASAFYTADRSHVSATSDNDTAAGDAAVNQAADASSRDGAVSDLSGGTPLREVSAESTDGIAVSAKSPDHDKIGTKDDCNTCLGGYAHDSLVGSYNADHFVFASISGSREARPDFAPSSKSESDRTDLTALGALTFVVLALDPSSTTVPAHTIAWLYDSSANQTIVYVNPTDQPLSIGDSSLVEIHQTGFSTVQLSDFVVAPETSAHAIGAEPANLDPGAGNEATSSAPTTSDVSSGEIQILRDRAVPIGGHDNVQFAKASGCASDAGCERIVLIEHTRFVHSDEAKAHLNEAGDGNTAGSPPSKDPPVDQLHHTASPPEDKFVFGQPPTPGSGNETAPAEERPVVASGEGSITSPEAVSATPIEASHHGLASVHVEGSFRFKHPGSHGSDFINPEPEHAAAWTRAGADAEAHQRSTTQTNELSVHWHEAAEASATEPRHWGFGAAAHAAHDLIV